MVASVTDARGAALPALAGLKPRAKYEPARANNVQLDFQRALAGRKLTDPDASPERLMPEHCEMVRLDNYFPTSAARHVMLALSYDMANRSCLQVHSATTTVQRLLFLKYAPSHRLIQCICL